MGQCERASCQDAQDGEGGNQPNLKFFPETLCYGPRKEPLYLVPALSWYHKVLCGSQIRSVAWTNTVGP